MDEHVNIPEMAAPLSDKTADALTQVKETGNNAINFVTTKFHEYKGGLVQAGIYFGIGFLIGFLFKKHIKYIVLLVVFIASLVVLEQFDLLHTNINWMKVNDLLGLQSNADMFDTYTLSPYVEWIKANTIIFLSAVAGFLIGLKLG